MKPILLEARSQKRGQHQHRIASAPSMRCDAMRCDARIASNSVLDAMRMQPDAVRRHREYCFLEDKVFSDTENKVP
jgi:hypothetical protein